MYFFDAMTFHVMSLSILTFRIMTLSPKDLFATLSINYIHHNGAISSANMLSVAPHLLLWRMSLGIVVIMLNVVKLSVVMLSVVAQYFLFQILGP